MTPPRSFSGRLLPILFAAAAPFALVSPAHAQVPPAKPDPARAELAYVEGARELDHRDLAAAQQQFARAALLDPSRRDIQLALALTREHRVSDLIHRAAAERMVGHFTQADTLLAQARVIDPTSDLLAQHQPSAPDASTPQVVPAEPTFAPPVQIVPTTSTPPDFHLRGDIHQVLPQLAAAYGVKVVIDPSVQPVNLRFDLESAPFDQAMPVLLRMVHAFGVAVDAHTLLVADDTDDNRAKYERQAEETVFIPATTQAELNELTNIVKNVFDVRQVVASPASGAILIRAPQSTLTAINYTLADLVDGGAQVMLELKLIAIDKTHVVDTGASTPTSAGIFSVAAEAQSLVSANQSAITAAISSGAFTPTGNTAQDLITEALYLILTGIATDTKVSNLVALLGNGLTLTGVYLGSSGTFHLGLNASDTRALDDITVRVGDRETTTLRVGEKYPITTATYSSGLSSSTSSLLNGVTVNGVSASSLLSQYLGNTSSLTVPVITFEDLGLTLKTTPTVLRSGLVSLHIELKLEALTGGSLDNIPILTSRAFTSDITLRDGATGIMLSELSRAEITGIDGFPGLAELPGFQGTLAEKSVEHDTSELMLLVTPHLVRRRPDSLASPRIAFVPTVHQDY